MNAINAENNTYTLDAVEKLITAYTVEAEELGFVCVTKAMFFHAGKRREEEIRNQNPGAATTKVYVVLKGRGVYTANAVETGEDIRLTHLEEMGSVEGFMKQINREVDRTAQGNRLLVAAWSCV